MQYVAGGIDEVRSLSRFRPWTILGTGLLVSALTATIPILGGHEVLESGVMTVALPAIGDVKITSALAFDVGVYLLVVGLILMVFESFGDEPPRSEEHTSELQSLMRISYAVFCLKKKTNTS